MVNFLCSNFILLFLLDNPFEVSSIILSSQFWPPFKNETLELPEGIQNEINRYTKLYETYKGNRTLFWRPVIGRVNIEIQLANKTLDMLVTPMQAVIIYYFQQKSEWTLDELCHVMKVPATVLRKRISFWQSQGLIREPRSDIFQLIEENTGESSVEMQTQSQECDDDDDEAESAMASASDQREEELQVFWSYIVGMLTNLDSLPLERIHQMLKMFASHGPGVEFSQEELKNFLQRKVREHELVFAGGGVYQLPK